MTDGKDAASLRELGTIYREGDGIDKDPTKAVELLAEASELGDAQAASSVGYMLMVGEGVPADASAALRHSARRVDIVVRESRGGGQPPRPQEPCRSVLDRVRRPHGQDCRLGVLP